MADYRSLLLSAVTIGATIFGISATAYAEWPSEADEANVTGSFDYTYTGSDGAEAFDLNIQVLSNRWLYLNWQLADGFWTDPEGLTEDWLDNYWDSWRHYIDCNTGNRYIELVLTDTGAQEAGFGVYKWEWDASTDTWSIWHDDEIVYSGESAWEEEENQASEMCQQAGLSDGVTTTLEPSSTASPEPSSTSSPTPATNIQIAGSYVAPTTANSLSNIGERMAAEDEPELATTYLKGALEEYEQARLNPNAPQPTKEEVERTYRLLAATLLEQDRTIEAQETLDAFTVWELAYYFDIAAPRTAMRISQQPASHPYAQAKALPSYPTGMKPNQIASADVSSSPVTILQAERDILLAHDADQAGAMASGIELARLLEIEPSQRTAAQNDRIAQLTALENDINRDFNAFIARPNIRTRVDELSDNSQRQTVNPSYFNQLRDKLAQLDAAVVYPLILEDRIELVVTTSQTAPLRRTVFVDQGEVQASVSAFRRSLLRRGDVMQRAQQLYQWLIAPIEDDLATAGVKSILYAPYGQLRYIPLTALHDGDQWLVENYGVNTITALSLQELTAERKADPRVLAGAFADRTLEYTVPLGDRSATMSGLPFAGREVELLTAERDNHTLLIDQDFSLDAVLPIMRNFDVIHFATHAAFIPGSPENSFILFGNGDRATLADIAEWVL
ncbi:MAG: CHAT domain-containing protein, partial [Cyanobacteria bacterium J06639_14]